MSRRTTIGSILIVIGVSSVLTTIGIEATRLYGDSSSLVGRLIGGDTSSCLIEGMVLVPGYDYCIDSYEVSPGENCLHKNPQNPAETTRNLFDGDCTGQSVGSVLPWRFITQAEAASVCAKRGGRLPTNNEWYQAALGTPDNGVCAKANIAQVVDTGARPDCRSIVSAYDMVGNVWEYTADEVVAGKLQGELLPEAGYIEVVSPAGIVVRTASSSVPVMGGDYLWRSDVGRAVVLRGGFYGSGTDGGLYSLHAGHDPSIVGDGIGFRCVGPKRS